MSPSLPEEELAAKSPSTALSLEVVKDIGRELRASIVVGKTYDIVENQIITQAKIEKIYPDVSGNLYVMMTKPIKGKFGNRSTIAMPVAEFKARVLLGGVSSIEL